MSKVGRQPQRALLASLDGTKTSNPYCPGFAASLRLLLVVRVASALYIGISDCDETYNYWEALHLLTHPPGPGSPWQSPFQTWEYAPEYAIRSWAYLVQYLPVAGILPRLLGKDKAASFYITRVFLAFCSSACESALVQSAANVAHPRVGLYLLILLMTAAGMYESATALLPSTFVMYTTTLAWSFALYPSQAASKSFPASTDLPTGPPRRTLLATCSFALGALLAWPFAIVLALPFVFEELFLNSALLVPSKRRLELVRHRIVGWTRCVAVAALLAVPIVVIDTLAYGRPAVVPLNIVVYNILSARRGAGPTLYGTEPWHYYLLNLTLNFGPALYLALASMPIASVAFQLRNTEGVGPRSEVKEHKVADSGSSRPSVLLAVRLSPLYLWLGLLSAQPHKEERFVFAAYPLLCFNAAVAVFCTQSVLAASLSGQKRASSHFGQKLGKIIPASMLAASALLSLARIAHLRQSYKAPISILEHLAAHELPRVREEGLSDQASLRLCYGKEWHRFPSTYLVPAGIRVDFIKSDFKGILPKHFAVPVDESGRIIDDGNLPAASHKLDTALAGLWPWRASTRALRSGFNDLNLEEPDRYVDIHHCDYLIDVDFPHAHASTPAKVSSSHEPRFILDRENWSQVYCEKFLDAPASRASPDAGLLDRVRATIERVLWIPPMLRKGTNRYGDYCLLRAKR